MALALGPVLAYSAFGTTDPNAIAMMQAAHPQPQPRQSTGKQFSNLKKLYLESAKKAGMKDLTTLKMGPDVPRSASFSLHEMIRRMMAGGWGHGQATDLLTHQLEQVNDPNRGPGPSLSSRLPTPDSVENNLMSGFQQMDPPAKQTATNALYRNVADAANPRTSGRGTAVQQPKTTPREAAYNVNVQVRALMNEGYSQADAYTWLYQNLLHKFRYPQSQYRGP